ncbi:ArsR/SmtB family transcription factor [Fundicoccus culcitae]|uniref:Metalloregulator ArsR/SmtB family transcription factor n=1 Tax=Fundicoccus culcitae TaxID=2969821 RepID=A0ABY5P509_9LACT|nr:metalloregulator ArsR/SmtB family transcription factor [Fundicoccus culcitae]UUX33513.1 metalloregulator ArsR/SmtB family transcription factor [Fundicoccus culcitae]
MNYERYAKVMKALSDPSRVQIMDMLSCGKMCACDLLEHFDFTQPTLSHHIKVLKEAGLVNTEKNGTWHHYSTNLENVEKVIAFSQEVFSNSERCICHTTKVEV